MIDPTAASAEPDGIRSPLESFSHYRGDDWTPERVAFHQNLEQFADRVGWRKPRWLNLEFSPKIWRKYENLTFKMSAPRGHLPSLFFWEGFNLVDTVLYRLEICRQSMDNS